jgi:hypothetical protein
VVKSLLAGEPRDFMDELLSQGAADATVVEFDNGLGSASERRRARLDMNGINVETCEVVHEYGDPSSVLVREQMIQERRFPGSEKPRKYSDG